MINLIKIIIGGLCIAIAVSDIADTPLTLLKSQVLSMSGIDLNKRWLTQLYDIDMKYPNTQQRIEMYQQQVTRRNPYAPILLSTTQLNLQGTPRNSAELTTLLDKNGFDIDAIDQLEDIIDDDDVLELKMVSEAMYLLGNYHYHMEEYNQSRDRLKQAVTYHKHLPAMNLLAFIYLRGLGDVEPSMEKTVEWHRKAAEGGYSRSMTNLADIYAKGYATSKKKYQPNHSKAVYWYEQAAESGNASGIYMLARYIEEGKGGQITNPKLSVDMYLKAAKLGNKYAMYAVAEAYEQGQYVPQDTTEAIRWYKKSEQAGNSRASAKLQQLLTL